MGKQKNQFYSRGSKARSRVCMNKHVTINTASLAALCALAAAAAAADASSKYGARAQHAGERPSPIVSFVYAHFSHFMCALRRHTNKCNNNQTETKTKKTHTKCLMCTTWFSLFSRARQCVSCSTTQSKSRIIALHGRCSVVLRCWRIIYKMARWLLWHSTYSIILSLT